MNIQKPRDNRIGRALKRGLAKVTGSLALNQSEDAPRIEDLKQNDASVHQTILPHPTSLNKAGARNDDRPVNGPDESRSEATPRIKHSKQNDVSVHQTAASPHPVFLNKAEVRQNEGPVSEASGSRNGPSVTLCQVCQYIFERWHEVPTAESYHKSFPFYKNTSFMKQAAADGCLLCGQFLGILDSAYSSEDLTIDRGLAVEPVISGFSCWRIKLYVLWESKSEIRKVPIVMAFPQAKLKVEPHSEGIRRSPSVAGMENENSLAAFGMLHKMNGKDALLAVQQWLDKCHEKHPQCRVPERKFLPTRLIYLDDSFPRLLRSDAIKNFPRYATLSHCWGNVEYATLNKRNMECFKEKIPLEALPQTFLDAIEVARSLGISYLWVDSLCIMQDTDSDDWFKEASQMTNVYSSSFLNIGATCAIDSSKGLFSPRDMFRNSSFYVPVDDEDYTSWLLHCVPASLYTDSISRSPLAQRGWVMQERLLAPRTVHFAKDQVFWECNDNVICEAHPEKLPSYLTTWSNYVDFLEKKPLAQYSWKEIVDQYSSCKLTFASDRLVAISGIARAREQYQQGEYLAGLWAGGVTGYNLVRQLCWETIRDRLPRPIKYQGPTWSWSAINSVVRLKSEGPIHDEYSPVHVQLLDKEIELTASDRFGAVSSARLHLLCDALFHVDASELDEKGYFTSMEGTSVHRAVRSDCYDEQVIGGLYLLPLMSKVSSKAVDTHFRIVCSSRSFIDVEGLALKRTNSERRGEYQRVGHFRANKNESWLQSPSNEIPPSLPESAYEEIVDGRVLSTGSIRPRYTISLI